MTPREVLLTVLSEQDADDVIEHRRSKSTAKPFDVYRAKLVRDRLLRSKDRQAVVIEMVHGDANKRHLTPEFVRGVLHYDPDSGVFRRRETGEVAGGRHAQGYRALSVGGRSHLAHRLAWFYVHGVWPREQIDHIDRDRSNNRISNLRECSNQENNWNLSQRPNKSGVSGVHRDKKRWVAMIRINGKTQYIGRFATKEEAGAAYQEAVRNNRGYFLEKSA